MHRRISLVLMLAACGDTHTERIIDPPVPPDSVCFSSCFDDGDPCTDEMCSADGTCLHVPRNPFGACQTAAHCDDGNPCTVDTCELDSCDLQRCQNMWREMCQPCDFGCDDGNPCTKDTCQEDGTCGFGEPDARCDPMCRWTAALTPTDAISYYYPGGGYIQHYAGLAAPLSGLTCNDGQCVCQSELSLRDEWSSFKVHDLTGDTSSDAPWACDVWACEVPRASCAPMALGVSYVAWGEMRYLTPRSSAGAPNFPADTQAQDVGAVPPIDAFDVHGYCLSARWDHLSGRYAATFESDGQTASFELAVALDLGQTPLGSMRACTGCAEMGVPEGQSLFFDMNSDVVGLVFEFAADTKGHATLFSGRTAFSGDVTDAAGAFVGQLTLERLAP